MVHALKLANIMTIKHKLAPELIHILFDFVMLNHNNNQINAVKELVQTMELVVNYVLFNDKLLGLPQGDAPGSQEAGVWATRAYRLRFLYM